MSDNVISIFSAKSAKKPSPSTPSNEENHRANAASDIAGDESFEDLVRKNMEAKRRMATDRLKANKSVLKSYRIKPKK